ncbi:hypothetical protein NDU88_008147 [Pleurodeles waltl]|uniref:Uncharacterized protein n=1 Tax=Pleurodeles waltl TaxID=8319 RepID=A0AAV7N5I5_PLEWA|nr:hypothetical protein NDU88_008147 [Pleurodeles waltl]
MTALSIHLSQGDQRSLAPSDDAVSGSLAGDTDQARAVVFPIQKRLSDRKASLFHCIWPGSRQALAGSLEMAPHVTSKEFRLLACQCGEA